MEHPRQSRSQQDPEREARLRVLGQGVAELAARPPRPGVNGAAGIVLVLVAVGAVGWMAWRGAAREDLLAAASAGNAQRVAERVRAWPSLANATGGERLRSGGRSYTYGDGSTALHRAAGAGSPETVKVLLEAGADPNRPDRRGQTPLHVLAWTDVRQAECAAVLLQGGADPGRGDDKGDQPLRVAALEGQAGLVVALLEGGARLEAPGEAGQTALHGAAQAGSLEIVKLLLDRGASRDTKDAHCRKPWHMARDFRHPEVQALLEVPD